MTNSEIREWAKKKIKGNIWKVLIAVVVAGFLTGLSIPYKVEDGRTLSFSLGWIFYFVQVGLCYFMVKFVTDQDTELGDIFHFANDFGRTLVVNLLQSLIIGLWCLLLIVPGIIKAFAYALVPYLLADEKYKDLGYMDVLKKSEEMMNGHKMDFFMLHLSFIGWYLLSILTFGILLIWVLPYHETASAKFLNDLKTSCEK